VLFEHQHALDEPHLLGYAREFGLDAGGSATALRERTYAGIVDESKRAARKVGSRNARVLPQRHPLRGRANPREPHHAIDWLLEHGTASS